MLFDILAGYRYNKSGKDDFMQTCYNCGKQVEDNVLICPDCGALVKRYTSAPKQEPVSQPAQPGQTEGKRLYVDENGVVQMRGGMRAWLIITAILAGFLLFSFGVLLFAYYNQDVYVREFQMMPAEVQAMLPMSAEEFLEAFRLVMDSITPDLWLVYAILALLAGKLGTDIWLISSRKKAALIGLLTACALLAVALMFFGYANYALYVSIDGAVTAFLLRRDRALLR